MMNLNQHYTKRFQQSIWGMKCKEMEIKQRWGKRKKKGKHRWHAQVPLVRRTTAPAPNSWLKLYTQSNTHGKRIGHFVSKLSTSPGLEVERRVFILSILLSSIGIPASLKNIDCLFFVFLHFLSSCSFSFVAPFFSVIVFIPPYLYTLRPSVCVFCVCLFVLHVSECQCSEPLQFLLFCFHSFHLPAN